MSLEKSLVAKSGASQKRSPANPLQKPVQAEATPHLTQIHNGLIMPGAALQLQRSVGNRAVNRLLSKSKTSQRHTLPENVQHKMESSFAADFSNVSIQEGIEAPAIGALAYTQGESIHFAPGQYDPHSQGGQQLLGHELAHVVQQRSGEVTPTVQAKGLAINTDSALEQEADHLGEQAASGQTLVSSPEPTHLPSHSENVIQGMFAEKGFTSYTKRTDLEELLKEVDEEKIEETKELFKETTYYDWDAWKDDGKKKVVEPEKVKELLLEAEDGLEEKEEPYKEPEPPTDLPPTYLQDQIPDYVPSEHRAFIRSLGGPERSQAQVVLHALGKSSRLKNASPMERVKELKNAVLKSSPQQEDSKNESESKAGPLIIFVAPEGYFSFIDREVPKETSGGRHQYTKEQYEEIVDELQQFSLKVPNTLIIPGSIMWFDAPQEEPPSEKEQRFPLAKHIEYTYNTSPVVYQGNVFLYNKHANTGGDIDNSRLNQRMKMEEIGRLPFNQLATVGYFDVGGLRIGLEICGDHGYQVLHKALETYKHEQLHVDFHILIAAGQDPTDKYPYHGDGWVINADIDDKGSFSVYKVAGGRIDKKKNLLSEEQSAPPKDTDKLVVVEQFLGSIGSEKEKN